MEKIDNINSLAKWKQFKVKSKNHANKLKQKIIFDYKKWKIIWIWCISTKFNAIKLLQIIK